MSGAKRAIHVFFDGLNQDIKGQDRLNRLLRPKLYEAFRYHHESFKEMGLELNFNLWGLKRGTVKNIWITFGSPDKVTSSLLPAPIKESFGSLAMLRHKKEVGYLFREISFEYVFEPKEISFDEDGGLIIPSLSERANVARKGHIAAVDVEFFTTCVVTVNDPSDEKSSWKQIVERPMLFRFETTHFKKVFNGSWRIADVDNCIASDLFEEK